MKQNQRFKQTLKQKPHFSLSMKRGLHLLTLPLLELNSFLEQQIEQNPFLQRNSSINPDDSSKDLLSIENELDDFSWDEDEYNIPFQKPYRAENFAAVSYTPSIRDELINQANLIFANKEERKISNFIIGCIEPTGYLTITNDELAKNLKTTVQKIVSVLTRLKMELSFPGVFAKNPQESLLLQLKEKGKESSLAYLIVKKYYDQLLNRHMHILAKKCGTTSEKIQKAIKEDLAPLQVPPLQNLRNKHPVQMIKADILIEKDLSNEKWIVKLSEEDFDPLFLDPHALFSHSCCQEKGEKQFFQRFIKDGMDLIKSIDLRQSLLKKIGLIIVERFSSFLEGNKNISPMGVDSLAKRLDVHPSTISRAIREKHLQTPVGLIPLNTFFTGKIVKKYDDHVSAKELLEKIVTLVNSEDKNHPLSDIEILKLLKDKGYDCSRRTVTKYRKKLKIHSSYRRKKSY